MSKTEQKKREVKDQSIEGTEGSERGTPARVEIVVGRTGFKGEVTQVKCKLLAGPEKGKDMRRNVVGPVKEGDILMLRETEIEARRIKSNVNKGAFS